jgi:hypothetical protein
MQIMSCGAAQEFDILPEFHKFSAPSRLEAAGSTPLATIMTEKL